MMKSGAQVDVQASRQGDIQHVILLSLSVNVAILLCVRGAEVLLGGRRKCEKKNHRVVCRSQKHMN